MPENHLPDKNKIEELRKSMDNYKRKFIIKEENKEIIKIHTWKNPYPEMYFKKNEDEKIEIKKDEKNIEDNSQINKIKIIKENLNCFISKLNYIDNQNLLLGYPIKKYRNGKIIPIPEILSYDSYIMQLSNKDEIVDNERVRLRNMLLQMIEINENNLNFINTFLNNNINHSFKSANNEYYENWLPIYINENHYLHNQISILNSFSIIKYGNLGLKEYDFKPEHIFEILPNLLFEMIKKMYNNKSSISSSFIICYFQYMLLFQKLFQNFSIAYERYINDYLNDLLFGFFRDKYFDNLNIIEKALNLLLLMFFINEGSHAKEIEKLEEYLKRLKNQIYLDLFKNNYSFIMDDYELFIDDLFKYDIFYKIVDLISLNKSFLEYNELENNKNARKIIIIRILFYFEEIYQECEYILRKRIDKILINNLDLRNYFNLDAYLDYNIFF